MAFDIYYERIEEMTVLMGWFGEYLKERAPILGVQNLEL